MIVFFKKVSLPTITAERRAQILNDIYQCTHWDISRFYQTLNEAERNDYDIVIKAIKVSKKVFQYVPDKYKSDKEIVKKEILSMHPLQLKHVSDDLKADREIVMEAVKQNGVALRYAAAALKADLDVVFEAVNQDEKARQYASPSINFLNDLNKRFLIDLR